MEAEPQLEGSSDSENESEEPEPEPELLPDSDSESDEPEPEPELLPDGDQPRTIFDQSDEDWIATAQRGMGTRREANPRDSTSRIEWWRAKARNDIAARLKDGAPPLPVELKVRGEQTGQAEENEAPVDVVDTWQPPVPACESSSSVSDGEAAASDSYGSQEWEVQEPHQQRQQEQSELHWQEQPDQQQPSDDESERDEAAMAADRERELQEMRSEFSDLQDLVKRMRSPIDHSAGASSGQRQHTLRTRSVQEIESQIEASVDLSEPVRSPAGTEVEVAGWLVTRRLARAEELIGQLEGVTVDDKSADIVSSPFKVEHGSVVPGTNVGTEAATPRASTSNSATASRRRPRRSPGSTQPAALHVGKHDGAGRRSVSSSAGRKPGDTGHRRGDGGANRTRHEPSALTPRQQPNPTSSTATRRRSAQRPGAKASGGEATRGKHDTLSSTNRGNAASAMVGPHAGRSRSHSRSRS